MQDPSEELAKVISEDGMRDALLLVFAKKQAWQFRWRLGFGRGAVEKPCRPCQTQ